MKFTNRQFGELEFDEQHVIEFSDGIIGFGEFRKYLIVDDEDSQPFRWLVSLEEAGLSFAMIDPALIIETYQSSVLKDLDATVFLLVALKDPVEQSTTNLRGPIVVDNTTRRGRQLILDDESLSICHPLFSRKAEIVEA